MKALDDIKSQARIRRAQSCATDTREAVREFHATVTQPDMALIMFFCSSEYDLKVLAEEMRRMFSGIQVVGCTTAGEIGPIGYRDHSLCGASFPAGSFSAASGVIENLQKFEITAGQAFTQDLLQKLESRTPHAGANNSFALLLIDGLSVREEPVTGALQSALGKLPLFGGSAGDGLTFGTTQVYFEGRFYTDSAVLTLVTTRLPFTLFKTQHFVATDQRLVVTETDSDHRIVKEINGLPAAQEFARILGINAEDLDPMRFAASPVVVMIDGTNYVRSIQKANSDGSLTFYCAIEDGLVLRVAKGVDLLENLEQAFARIHAEIGPPQLVIGCDCILRKLEISLSPVKDRIGELLEKNHTIGFNTYGLPQMTKDDAVMRAEQVRSAVATAPVLYGTSPITVTASFGVATFPNDGYTGDELIAAADRAMYAAKESGRNRINVSSGTNRP